MNSDSILTKRESEVVRLYAEGYIGKEIASMLNTSYYTVVNHTQNVYEKLGIRRSTNALVAWWFCINFNIYLNPPDNVRRGGATVLLLLFCFSMSMQSNDIAIRVRTSRRGRENEQIMS